VGSSYDKNNGIAFWKRKDETLDPLTPRGAFNWMKERNLNWKDIDGKKLEDILRNLTKKKDVV